MAANTIITSVVTGGTNSHTTVAEEVNAYATDFVTQGVVGAITLNTGSGGTGSFCVNADASPDMGVTIKAGQAYISATPSSQDAQVLRARASSDYTAYTINANASGSTKYDWIYLKVDATKANTPAADASDVTSIYTSRSSSNSTDNGSPPTYGLLLAIVTVANGASSITNSNITDKRFNTSIGAQNGSLVVTQQSTGTDAIVQAAGTDANINLDLKTKGTGTVNLTSSTVANFAGKLGYAEITSPFTTTTAGSFVDVTNLTTTVTVPSGGRDLKVTVKASVKTSGTAGNGIELAILDGSTIIEIFHADQPVAGFNVPMCFVGRVSAPTAGSHTYKVQGYQSGAGTLTVSGGARTAGNTGAAFILVEAM